MAWDTDRLSTVEQLKDNLPALLNSTITDDFLDRCIEAADEVLYDDISNNVDWDEIEDLDEVPRVINRLSQYQSVALTLIRTWRNEENIIVDDSLGNSILKKYEDMYKKLIKQINSGEIKVLDSGNEELTDDVFRTPGVGRII